MQETIPARCLYRATFRNPIARSHQLQLKVRCDVEIEIYPESRQRWKARSTASGRRFDVSGPTPAHVQKQIRELFEEQVSEWAVYDEQIGKPMPEPKGQPKPPTHIMCDDPLARHIDARKNCVRAICGKLVRRRQIVSDQTLEQWLQATRDAGFLRGGDILLTCPQCRIIVKKAENELEGRTEQ